MIDPAKPIQRTGPVLIQDCFACEGVGKPNCPICTGTGKLSKDIHPFGALEALVENLQQARRYLGAYADDDGHTVVSDADVAHARDRLEHVEALAQNLLQHLVLLLPEEWERTEGP